MKTQQVPSLKKGKPIIHDTHGTGREGGESGKEPQERAQLVQGEGGQVEGTDKAQAKAVSDRPQERSDRKRSANLQRGQGLGHSLEGSAKTRKGFP